MVIGCFIFNFFQFNAVWAFAGANLRIHPAHIDFGTIEEGPPARANVVIENGEDFTIHITHVRTNCGCTRARVEKKTLKPGEKTVLKIIYDTKERPGIFRKKVMIKTDMPGQKRPFLVRLEGTVKESVVSKIRVKPRIIDIGAVGRDFFKKHTFTIMNIGSAPLIITKIYSKRSNTLYFDGERENTKMVIDPKDSKQIELDIKVFKEGAFIDLIYIESNARNSLDRGYILMIKGQVI